MLVVFVHGWSVTNTNTYGGLPAALVKNAPGSLKIQVTHLYLGKYVSFADEVRVDDIARAMHHAVQKEIVSKLGASERFACITHSTGAAVVRTWIDLYYRERLSECPLGNLIMLAPANHGSALAQLGKGRLSRLKFAAEGVSPGVGVLDWLELGSDQSWDLNRRWMSCDLAVAGIFAFVLTGQTIDRKFYDNLNSYTGEAGSDGVVRVAATNLNYGLIRLVQQKDSLRLGKDARSKLCPLGILPGLSHSGTEIGILGGVQAGDDGTHPTVQWTLRCLDVRNAKAFKRVARELEKLTEDTQEKERVREDSALFLFKREFTTQRYSMLVIRIMDDRSFPLSDYDLVFTAGPSYDPNHLPEGFFVDRQRNQRNPGKLTFYINFDAMEEWFKRSELQDKFGFRVVARPASGFAYYTQAEYQGRFSALKGYFIPNQTMMVEIELQRHVSKSVFEFTQNLGAEEISRKPGGGDIA